MYNNFITTTTSYTQQSCTACLTVHIHDIVLLYYYYYVGCSYDMTGSELHVYNIQMW